MPLIQYETDKIKGKNRQVVDQANDIIREYSVQGYDLTLRQLYYQFVARDLLANNMKSYKRLGKIISDARRMGLIDWDYIVDRTRFVRGPQSWSSPAEIVESCAAQYDVDWWADQDSRVEVWIEKDALVGVLQTACAPWHCPYFSCRGYVSDSEIWASAQRMSSIARKGQTTIVLHLGDHDPSGVDMSRDIEERLLLFASRKDSIEVRRVALTMPQIEEVEPPPNPAKTTDSRFRQYAAKYGDESWELDALDPTYISKLIAAEMGKVINKKHWKRAEEQRDAGRAELAKVAENFDRVVQQLEDENR